ncbi:hypothetical protein BG006_003389 [Podila minutissima]|uniref:Uncharacterized protein n=1 Tax=Podila minutissima TaxID=64525 RepID=A0A9P5VN94_9FUNG|nr:hypothetical protein BG006_003389 [Podila minutissima]
MATATIELIPPTNTDNEPHQHIRGLSADAEHILVIIAAVLGSVLLILSLILFYICMKHRYASHRIGQLQEFLPTFMDQEKTESYFKNAATSSVSSSSPKTPPNVHHRTLSAPVAFAKGGKGSTQLSRNMVDRDGSSGGQFQQISLIPEETSFVDSEEEAALKKSLSTAGPTRTRATTVSTPPSATVSSLHQGVSLSHHRSVDHSSRTPPTDDDFAQDLHDDDALPTTGLRFAEGEMLPVSNSSSNASVSRSGGYASSSNRYSLSMEFNNLPPRFSATSHLTHSMDFDPTRFSTTSVMFDAKRLSILSGAPSEMERGVRDDDDDDDDDGSSISSSDDFDHLPAHQKPQNFESHAIMDMMSPQDLEDELYTQEQHGLRSSPSTIAVAVPVSVTHQLQQQGAW